MGLRVTVIGAGFGGLTAAGALARAGAHVTVLERAGQVGGKAGQVTVDGAAFDTGPSLLTLVDVVRDAAHRAGCRLEDWVDLRVPSPAFRYHYADGSQLDVHHCPQDTLDSVRGAFGTRAADELEAFMAYARQIWQSSAPAFVYDDSPTVGKLLRSDVRTIFQLRHIDAFRSMQSAIEARIRDPRLRQLLMRYATYNGSDVRSAPATLNCIAHVELGLGGYGVVGGMHALATGMQRYLAQLGADIQLGADVGEVLVQGGCVRGVRLRDGREVAADAVVCNAEARFLFEALLPEAPREAPAPQEPSMSAYTCVFRARRQAPGGARMAHNVVFPVDYDAEFADIFDRQRIPETPTVYACDQSLAHGRPGWGDAVPVFAMVNCPPVGPRAGMCGPAKDGVAQINTVQINTAQNDAAQNDPAQPAAAYKRVREFVSARLTERGILALGDEVVWERTPQELAAQFPGSSGSLYGAASNSRLAAFRRAPNRIDSVRGLYVASGSAHPGGGVPLAILSGLAATRAVHRDFGERIGRWSRTFPPAPSRRA